MVVVEGTAPAAVDVATSTANVDCKEGDDVAVAAGGSVGDGATDACLGASRSVAATATETAASVDAATPPARKKVLDLGLVSSIRYEPLRCHPSDAPAPDDPAVPDPASLPTSCARVRRSTNGILDSGNGVGMSSMACLVARAKVKASAS